MAEQTCNVIKQGGSSVKIYDLGTGTSFNVSNIKGYQSFTVNNFLYYVTSAGGGNIMSASSHNGDPRAGSGISVGRNYDNSTGTYSVSIKSTLWVDFDGAIHDASGSNSTVHAYLITDMSKIKQYS